jgi:hypothetical protein
VIAVKDGKPELISDSGALEKFMKANLKPVKDRTEAKMATFTWLRLSQELHQDGFFKFKIPDKDLTADKDAKIASGKAVVEPKGGDKGEITVTLTFDGNGKLARVEEKSTLQAGIRPICQATKLLDADPVVRHMAEKDILVMAQSCKQYLDEQRAKASAPLRQAIDNIWRRIVDEDR